jgi:hypothetical protein
VRTRRGISWSAPIGRAIFLELVVILVDAGVLAIHAMPLRRSTQRELFGEQD